MKIKKAIIPVAGMGTRFLPATKAQPKAMLTLVDKPVIQFIVEEAVASGIEEIIFVTDSTKRAIEDHFDSNFELETRLAKAGKKNRLEEIRRITKLAKFAFVRQDEPRGNGHAILAALPFVGNDEAVLVMFGDDMFHSERPASAQIIETFERYNDPVIGLQEVSPKDAHLYGIASGRFIGKSVMEIDGWVEKPAPGKEPSNLASVARYVVTPEILRGLHKIKPGNNGEIGLSEAFIEHLRKGKAIYGHIIEGRRHDCGNKLEFLKASVEFGLRHEEVNGDGEFTDYLKKLVADMSRKKNKRARKV